MISRTRPNVPIAIVSLSISILLWLVVFGQNTRPFVTRAFMVPLSADALKEDQFSIVQIPETVSVSISAPEERFKRLRPENFLALVDLSRAAPGARSYPVQVYPAELREVLTNGTLNARVEVEPVASRSLRITVDSKGELADPSLQLEGLLADPTQVKATGPKSQVDAVRTIRGFVDLTEVALGARERADIPLEALDARGRVLDEVRTEPLFARVRLILKSAPEEKAVLVVPNFRGSPAAGYVPASYTLTPTQLTVRGRSLVLAGFSKASTEPIDLTGLTKDKEFDVAVRLPSGARAVRTARVKVRVRIAPVNASAETTAPTEAPAAVRPPVAGSSAAGSSAAGFGRLGR